MTSSADDRGATASGQISRAGGHEERVPVIVSIQSQLVYGCAGNNAAVPVLRRLGSRVYAVPTILLSNTPHYPTISGGPLDPSLISGLLDTLLDRLPPNGIDGVLTGYMGSEAAIPVVAAFIDRVRAAHPGVTVLCDPVMGDIDCGAYVPAEVSAAITDHLVPRADILTPNPFEADVLSRRAAGASTAGLGRGRRPLVATTGIIVESGAVRTELTGDHGILAVETPRLNARPTGTGDVFAAALLHHILRRRPHSAALELAVETVFGAVEHAIADDSKEMDPSRMGVPNPENSRRFPATHRTV